jgi:UDP-N-acetylmuramyl pentapeptide phosphotransferase/UDP-N-acetylglucosamine-1-phosphate transferase
MLYYLFEYLEKHYDLAGAGLFQYISFRSAMAFIVSLLFSTIYGKRIINYLQHKQVGESVRDLGLEGQVEKAGTPTMGGIIIILATLIPVLFFSIVDNVYIVILLVTTIWMGTIGFIDDYIKIFRKNKQGLKGRFKILGQVTATANTLANVYVVPAASAAVVNSIHVTNLSASNASFSIAVIPSGQVISSATLPKFFIIRGSVIAAGDTAQLDFPITLPAASVLAANASTASISISAFGLEIT